MTAWVQQGVRLDIGLAVALEVAVLRLRRAQSAAERRDAVAFNLDLWQVAGTLAPTSPVAADRDGLAAAAATVAAGRMTVDELAEINVRFAHTLAGRAATEGGLRHILGEWHVARRAAPERDFGGWLLGRLDGFAAPRPFALAA